jgi:hypothetical protein
VRGGWRTQSSDTPWSSASGAEAACAARHAWYAPPRHAAHAGVSAPPDRGRVYAEKNVAGARAGYVFLSIDPPPIGRGGHTGSVAGARARRTSSSRAPSRSVAVPSSSSSSAESESENACARAGIGGSADVDADGAGGGGGGAGERGEAKDERRRVARGGV